MTKVTYNYMTTNATFTIDALSTESVVEQIHTDENFVAALKLFAAAAQILDQYKRNFFYGERGAFDQQKLRKFITEANVWSSFLFNNQAKIATCKKDIPITDVTSTRMLHGIVGMATETGELVETLLTQVDGSALLDAVNIAEEVGDVNFYEAILTDALGTSIDECNAAVIRKLRKRYPNGFSATKAAERDLISEREELEKVNLAATPK